MRICVFCGSSTGRIPAYAQAAAGLGRLLAERGIGLVYGGATVGTMGVMADAALAAGGQVYGVIPGQLVDREIAHRSLTELYEVADMHQRKAKMAELADAFIALPGGAGTLEELFEVWTWAQLGLHNKPIGLLDVAGYFQLMTPLLDHMVAEGFLKPQYREALQIDADPELLLKRLAAVEPPPPKWSGAAASAGDKER
ncbi:LOG family protein [Microlunatus elymi]|uniref:LOG family protein n=1 Tax=Microlunatus elymi TaxID=2596828 RepID=UPI001D18AE03|nr:TIGR00730 family Rossman fold protein [Microlunatus elymi]